MSVGALGTAPLRLTDWAPLLPLLAMLSVAVLAPAVPGLNATCTVQLPPAATAAVQPLLTTTKSVAGLNVNAPIVSAAVPVLLTVTVCAGDCVPVVAGAKVNAPG